MEIQENIKVENNFTSIVKSLKGTFKTTEIFDYKEELSDILFEKYTKGK